MVQAKTNHLMSIIIVVINCFRFLLLFLVFFDKNAFVYQPLNEEYITCSLVTFRKIPHNTCCAYVTNYQFSSERWGKQFTLRVQYLFMHCYAFIQPILNRNERSKCWHLVENLPKYYQVQKCQTWVLHWHLEFCRFSFFRVYVCARSPMKWEIVAFCISFVIFCGNPLSNDKVIVIFERANQ